METLNLRHQVRRIMQDAWVEPGFSVPNKTTYPHQWLWDSCFHSLIWAALGDDRCQIELKTLFAHQDPNSGFVPHITYWSAPNVAASFWGRPQTSSLTQPPMYGHATAVAARGGWTVDDELLEKIVKAFAYLLEGRGRTTAGLIPVFHPWETGCDDSARWDSTFPAGPDQLERWRHVKGDLVASLQFDPAGISPVHNPKFHLGSIGFNALVVFNFREFLTIPGVGARPSVHRLAKLVDSLAQRLSERWDQCRQTWVDDGPLPSAATRTVDALLLTLVEPSSVLDQLLDPAAYGARFGPCGLHRDEPTFEPLQYWRGSTWPQLTYLLAVAFARRGDRRQAVEMLSVLQSAAIRSGFAEYWHPDTGAGGGAQPQTWTCLAAADLDLAIA